MNKQNKQTGFSLIELLIVVVIIGIIAAIAIPNLLAARRVANEGSAIASLRTIHSAQITYMSSLGNGDFAEYLSDLKNANLIDPALGAAVPFSAGKSGYYFNCIGLKRNSFVVVSSFACYASPANAYGVAATGTRDFGIDSTSGVIFTSRPNRLVIDQQPQVITIQTNDGSPLTALNN